MRIKNFLLTILCVLLLFIQSSQAEVSYNNWYVGNTQSGAWIQFKKVWLSAGNYRFTTRSVAKSENKTVKLQLNGVDVIPGVVVPTNSKNEFQLVHLGSKQITEGYYDVRLVFETGDVNCDMIFIRKGSSTSSTVLPDDINYTVNLSNKPLMAPIGGVSFGTAYLAKGGDVGDEVMWTDNNNKQFSRKQMLSWYKQQLYTYTWPISDEAQDMLVQEYVESKTGFIFAHGRGELDTNFNIEDRGYQPGIGGMGCLQNKKLVDAINRNEFAKDNLKFAFFSDNAVFPLACKEYLKKTMNWGDVACQEFIWNYIFKKWYQTIPTNMLFQVTPGTVPIQLWSANANYDYSTSDSKIYEFLKYIEGKMKSEFNLNVAWVLDGTFMSRDPRTTALAYGKQGWFIWGQNVTQMVTLNGRKFAFALNGGRLPLRSVWFNNWNPLTNSGTNSDNTKDYHISALLPSGDPIIRSIYQNAVKQGAEWLVMESWWDWYEGSIYCRSENPEHNYPNQFLSLIREYSDRNSESILLEAEGCDEFASLSTGNKGGAYRLHWYKDLDKDMIDADLSVDLDIFRPLHKIGPVVNQGKPTTRLKDFSVGFYDIWGFTDAGKVYCHEADGVPSNNWKAAKATNLIIKSLSLGGYSAWGISSSNKVISCNLSPNQSTENSSLWQTKTDPVAVVGVTTTLKEVFGIDAAGNVYYKDLSGKKSWNLIAGSKLKTITADDAFVWGFTLNGQLTRFSIQNKSDWQIIDNPYNLTKIDAGANEVWGINDLGDIYRISSSGWGEWEKVFSGYVNFSVGNEYVWLQDSEGTMFNCKIEGFVPRSFFQLAQVIPSGLESNNESGNLVKVLDNPFNDKIRVNVVLDNSSKIRFSLVNSKGQVLADKNLLAESGSHIYQMDGLDSLVPGIYVLTVEMGEHKDVFKVMKVN
jgi:hypothetical protein